MKNVILVCFFMLLTVSVTRGQKSKATPLKTTPTQETTPTEKVETKTDPNFANNLREHYEKKRVVATRWNDFDVAKDVMYDLIIEDPGNDSLIFQLAYLYYENQKYPSTILVGQDLLARNPKNIQVLELVGMSFENLSIFDRALQNYESLFLLTNNTSTLYKMAFIQYELKRYQESLTNIDILTAKPEAETLKVVFNSTENKQKEYSAKVALLNLKGMVYRDQGDKVNAKKYFEESLKLAPDFQFAKQNLDGLK